MPLFGAHNSISGGLYKALEAAQAHGMEAVQLFTANPQSWQVQPSPTTKPSARSSKSSKENCRAWPAKELSDVEVSTFRQYLQQTSVRVLLAHDSYLINLASPNDALYRRSVEAFIAEVQRAERLGLTYLV